MRGRLGALRRNLQNMRKSSRVADESMFGRELPIFGYDDGGGRRRFAFISDLVRAPLWLLSCFCSQPHGSGGADGAWASGEFARISEVNHLMVSDSMRYAILM
ncbi:uncharacterized protein LOC131148886 [Malania oleifera]|uniref:uncharacterized protein LOC131148886 n=1 Tax=Malania oleifera TaxID=397392 RepID=UPI0025ADCB27|nr:uncharacterized protein LOC131148886 [Malania oleifera]